MNSCLQPMLRLVLGTILFAGVLSVESEPLGKKEGPGSPTTGTNAVPQSVFTLPAADVHCRDPFFPKSVRLAAGENHKPTPALSSMVLVLNGLSGPPDHRLAMINGRTLAEGEETEFITDAGRVRVRCVQIKGQTVIVLVAGERRELRFRD
jgi:hypothetical protein